MNPRFTITNSMTQALSQIERARGFLEAAQLSDRWVQEMSERALLLEAHHTTHIEGTRLTLAQAEDLMAGRAVPEANLDDAQELLNYRDAFHLVSDYLDSGEPITEGLIREIHKRLVSGVRGGQARPGDYRTVQNYVANAVTGDIIYTPPVPGDVSPLMHELVEWLKDPGELHPVLVSGIAQFQLVHIHPFVDGNGRTSRLLSTLCLYRSGYDFKRLFTLSEFYDRNRNDFYTALQSVREREMDLTRWLDYFVLGLATQLTEVRESGSQAIQVELLIRDQSLNKRQAAALHYLLQHDTLTIQGYETLYPDVNRRTLQRDLKTLLDKGFVTAHGATHQLVYRLSSSE